MKRSSFQIFHKRRLAIFNFAGLCVLILAGCANLFSQELRKFRVEEGTKTTWELKLNDLCPSGSHFYRIRNEYSFITFAEPTDYIFVAVRSIKKVVATIDTTGLNRSVYGEIIVECLDCRKGRFVKSKIHSFQLTVTEPTEKPKLVETSKPVKEPKPTETAKLNEAPVETPAQKPTQTITPTPRSETSPATETTPTPTQTPDAVETSDSAETSNLTEASDLTETPAASPTTSTLAETIAETPAKTRALTSSPSETPVAKSVPDVAPIPTPLPEIPTITDVENINYLDYLPHILALVCALLLISLVAKKLFEKWKYGNNAAPNLGALKKAISLKEELAHKWLRKRKNQNLHAIGVGKIGVTNTYCIQLFVENANGEMPDNPPIHLLPEKYRKFPIVIYEMPRAEFLNANGDDYGNKAKEPHDTIIGGISGANTNLANEYGTIGYFCAPTILKPIRKFRKEIYLLSNSHVFANLSKPEECINDLIQQPSPGENKRHNFIASLENYVPILFDNDTENPNYIDAAIAKLLQGKQYKLEIPVIGKINSYLSKEKIEIRQPCRKFGRTTGYTQGEIFSIHLSIWIRYAATGQESFFKEQFLIVPTEANNDFIGGGDSGSLVADYENKAVGLIFAGANSNTQMNIDDLSGIDAESRLASLGTEKIRSFGVANSISEVLKSLNVKLIL